MTEKGEGRLLNIEPEESARQKIEFWDNFAKKHLAELRLLFRGGKLWEKEGWRNVVEHSLPQGAAAEVLSEMLKLPEEEKDEIVTASICHDWDKRLEKKARRFY